ncbi:MAG: response regulator transcription factor [Candidatus Krumholzibacteria bacterium]|jgi:DNA-binding response OmpR family regulator|nr:response regulator transcription factor [Candidatus Krumholzibacteria bacterium]MDP6668391.1 response regulator transcription factor [Candidatus Krumholzibacteria bacterium]MDP6797439.1 response regulator transcription factor [Candidatus Krumholzibacteria bacterium]MDP7022156.1 response regulator transcription factor [Candidatus Krumholzibacteria bacterium]
MKKRVLIVEDEEHLAEGLRINLELEGYEPVLAPSAEDGRSLWERGGVDLILMDVMLPGMDGFELTRIIRDRGDRVPILFLTARDRSDDRIRGLEEGGDDYITKPFQLKELLARVKGIFRRQDWYHEQPSEEILEWEGVRIDLRRFEAETPAGKVTLKEKEAMILRLLAERSGEPVDRDTIIDRIWGYDAYPSTRTVDNFVLSLRKILEDNPSKPRRILTAHGRGYRLKLD